MQTLNREDLKNAPYNPRTLNETQKRKLRSGLKKHGLVAPLTWNKRTGNLVGGHQRISQLDALMGKKNYELDVAVIDVDDAREKEINILLNNAHAMGDWDMDALSSILRDGNVDIEGTGFDHADLYRMFGDSPLLDRNEDLNELAEAVRKVRDHYNSIEKNNNDANDTEFYFVAVFRDAKDLGEFLEKYKLPDNRYQSGDDLRALLGEQLAK